MWKLTKRFTFEAAHRLPNHDGKCRRLHGHSWAAIVELGGSALHDTGPKQGMVVDYSDIKGAVGPLVEEYLDHHYLNETLEMENPTSEQIARWLFGKIKIRVPGLLSVTIEETCTCSCTYSDEHTPATADAKGQLGQ